MPSPAPFSPVTTPLAGSAVYTSPWVDTNPTSVGLLQYGAPVAAIAISSYADQASAAGGVVIQETDDINNANLVSTAASGSALAATLFKIYVSVHKRYWRVVYTNGTTAQSQFELTVSSFASIPTSIGGAGEPLVSVGGAAAAAIASGASTTALKVRPGRLCRIVVTTAGTASTTFYDNASAASGTVLFTTPTTTALGTIYDIQLPCANGIYAVGVSGSPGLTVSYI